jgi:N-glycosylase/DNA lyase
MSIQLNKSEPFDLDATLCCGQTFRWEKHGDWWYSVVKGKILKIRQTNNRLVFENVDSGFVKAYFRLDDDLFKVYSQISKDEHIRRAISVFRGLRILRQDPWECLISYICATYKSIAAIEHMLFNLSRRFGEKIHFDGLDFHMFPTPRKLARVHPDDLAKCGLGYRTKYVHETAKIINKNELEFERLKNATYKEAKAELVKLPGVGLKVADCVLLFSLEKLEAFPIDVWIKRAITEHYARYFQKELILRTTSKRSLTSMDYEKLNAFGREYFGEYAGYAQEYLYHYERTHC